MSARATHTPRVSQPVFTHFARSRAMRHTHHIVRDQLEVAPVHIDAVHGENALHLAQNRRTRHLDAVRLQDRVDVVRVDLVFFQDACVACAGKCPHPTQIGPVCRELRANEVVSARVVRW